MSSIYLFSVDKQIQIVNFTSVFIWYRNGDSTVHDVDKEGISTHTGIGILNSNDKKRNIIILSNKIILRYTQRREQEQVALFILTHLGHSYYSSA